MVVVSITGGIGSGKTSLVRALVANRALQEAKGVCVTEAVVEALDDWGRELLERSYTEPLVYSYDLQLAVLETQVRTRASLAPGKTMHGPGAADSLPLVLVERTTRDGLEVFVPLKVSLGHITPEQASRYGREARSCGLFADLTIFLDVPLGERWERVQRRGQTGDSAITEEYLAAEQHFLDAAYMGEGGADLVLRNGCGVALEEAAESAAQFILARVGSYGACPELPFASFQEAAGRVALGTGPLTFYVREPSERIGEFIERWPQLEGWEHSAHKMKITTGWMDRVTRVDVQVEWNFE